MSEKSHSSSFFNLNYVSTTLYIVHYLQYKAITGAEKSHSDLKNFVTLLLKHVKLLYIVCVLTSIFLIFQRCQAIIISSRGSQKTVFFQFYNIFARWSDMLVSGDLQYPLILYKYVYFYCLNSILVRIFNIFLGMP